jgi:hypothetical protein
MAIMVPSLNKASPGKLYCKAPDTSIRSTSLRARSRPLGPPDRAAHLPAISRRGPRRSDDRETRIVRLILNFNARVELAFEPRESAPQPPHRLRSIPSGCIRRCRRLFPSLRGSASHPAISASLWLAIGVCSPVRLRAMSGMFLNSDQAYVESVLQRNIQHPVARRGQTSRPEGRRTGQSNCGPGFPWGRSKPVL